MRGTFNRVIQKPDSDESAASRMVERLRFRCKAVAKAFVCLRVVPRTTTKTKAVTGINPTEIAWGRDRCGSMEPSLGLGKPACVQTADLLAELRFEGVRDGHTLDVWSRFGKVLSAQPL